MSRTVDQSPPISPEGSVDTWCGRVDVCGPPPMCAGMPLLIVCSLRLLWQAKEMWSLVRKSALAKLDMLKLPCGSAPFTSAWIGWRNSIPHIDEDGVCWDLLCVLKDNDALRSGGNTCVSPAASCVPRIPHSPRPPPHAQEVYSLIDAAKGWYKDGAKRSKPNWENIKVSTAGWCKQAALNLLCWLHRSCRWTRSSSPEVEMASSCRLIKSTMVVMSTRAVTGL